MKRDQPPIGIIITMGKEVFQANGGLLSFIRHFESCVRHEDSGFWLHKSKNCPLQDIAQVYIIVCNQVRYRVFFGGYERGPSSVFMRSGEERVIDWGRIILAGPFEKAPHKFPMRGFQGFRYVYEPIF
jgi:hypothetical protein